MQLSIGAAPATPRPWPIWSPTQLPPPALLLTSCTASEFNVSSAGDYTGFALGCPAMGAEQLEESEFEPTYQDLRGSLSGKPVGLFGSYGWGDGEWIRTWAEDAEAAGARLVVEPVMANGSPDGDAETACAALGTALANA